MTLNDSIPAMFSDDTNVTTTGSSMEDIKIKLNTELENLHHWLLANKLSLNVGKTECMMIGSRRKLSQITSNPEILIGSSNINRVSHTKTLGVLVDGNISWKIHVEVTKNFQDNPANCLERNISAENQKLLYQALVMPYFDYWIAPCIIKSCTIAPPKYTCMVA
jgi:hypothetical protein